MVLIFEDVHNRHSKQMMKDMQGSHHEYMHTLFKSSLSLASLLQTILRQAAKLYMHAMILSYCFIILHHIMVTGFHNHYETNEMASLPHLKETQPSHF